MTPRNTAISINICNGLTPTLYFFLIPVAYTYKTIDSIEEIIGCKILNLVNTSDVLSKSAKNPSTNEALGNKTSAKAVIEPVAPLKRNKEEINKKFLLNIFFMS